MEAGQGKLVLVAGGVRIGNIFYYRSSVVVGRECTDLKSFFDYRII